MMVNHQYVHMQQACKLASCVEHTSHKLPPLYLIMSRPCAL